MMMNGYSSVATFKLLGENALKGATLSAQEGETIHFLVTNRKQPNYLEYCERIEHVSNPSEVINRYTAHETQLFLKVNLSLASDSPVLNEYGRYISKLRNAIFTQPLYDDGLLFRGVDLSKAEVKQMEELKTFFIPSFTSTSVDSTKSYNKNAMLVIKTSYASQYACSITPKLSKYYHEEREVLISCYSAFRFERIERVNNVNVLTLYLDDLLSCMNHLD